MIDKLLGLSLEDLKNGYSCKEKSAGVTCNVCGKVFETGEMFPVDGKFYDAAKAVQIHIQKEHGSMLDILFSLDKKYTGITENQKELLGLINEGLTDSEIAQKTGVANATVRHQRFVFREKAKQAKVYLAIFELAEKSGQGRKGNKAVDEFINVHDGAKMVDDRYFITNAEEEKILATVFESLDPPRLKVFSSKEKKKVVILRKIAEQFEKGRKYSEKEINAVIKAIYEDFATIRRYLIEYGFMDRTSDGREYWLK